MSQDIVLSVKNRNFSKDILWLNILIFYLKMKQMLFFREKICKTMKVDFVVGFVLIYFPHYFFIWFNCFIQKVVTSLKFFSKLFCLWDSFSKIFLVIYVNDITSLFCTSSIPESTWGRIKSISFLSKKSSNSK